MKRLNFEIEVKAPVSTVWNTMLEDATYRQWTSQFHEGSHYIGDWEEGSKILFVGPDNNGMVARISKNQLYEYISIEHLGFIENGVEDTTSDEVKSWVDQKPFENYIFEVIDGTTQLKVEVDAHEDWVEMFNEDWPSALEKLKDLCEHKTKY